MSRQVLNISKDRNHPIWVFRCSAPHCEAFSLHLMRIFHCISCPMLLPVDLSPSFLHPPDWSTPGPARVSCVLHSQAVTVCLVV